MSYNDIMTSGHIQGLPRIPRGPHPSFEPTDIVKMICNECGQVYTRRSGLMVNGKLSKREGKLVVKHCVGQPQPGTKRFMETDSKCGSTNYQIFREMKVNAMPIGRHFTDLSRKHN